MRWPRRFRGRQSLNARLPWGPAMSGLTMDFIISDLSNALRGALDIDPLTGLLPLAVVSIAQGLRAGGLGDVIGKSASGLMGAGLLHFLVSFVSSGSFSLGRFNDELAVSWRELMASRVSELLGYWIFLLLGIALIFALRSIFRR